MVFQDGRNSSDSQVQPTASIPSRTRRCHARTFGSFGLKRLSSMVIASSPVRICRPKTRASNQRPTPTQKEAIDTPATG